jgi:hypothetical protein
MSDASLALQKAIVAKLKADAGVAAIVGARVYDGVPATPEKPYIKYGRSDLAPELADGYLGFDESIQIDAWSAGPSQVQAKQIGSAIRSALHNAVLTLENGQRLVSLEVSGTNGVIPEPDGITQHTVVTVLARTEQTAD